jgi:poly-gamma-glutamate capsule biosynthesis protein CapA/YwtB (metallophosphatase superfamily)
VVAALRRGDVGAVRLSAVGDVQVAQANPGTAFELVHEELAGADVLFGNSEGAYSVTGERCPTSWSWEVVHPRGVAAVASAGFDVMSLANNHVMDGGYSGLKDTIEHLSAAGIATVGAGSDIAAARQPLVIERQGRTIAFLAYTCVYPPGFEARSSRPGCATITIHSVYRGEQAQHGTRPVVLTIVDPTEKRAMLEDARRLRERVDVLIASVHWGIHCVPAELTDYERELGHSLIDNGADVILGHHQHILKGIELYRGKPIFYGLGHFLMGDGFKDRVEGSPYAAEAMAPYLPFYGDYLGAEWHPEARRTVIAHCLFGADGKVEATVTPCLLPREDPRPRAVKPNDPEFPVALDYLRDIAARAGLDTRYEVQEERIAVHAAQDDSASLTRRSDRRQPAASAP